MDEQELDLEDGITNVYDRDKLLVYTDADADLCGKLISLTQNQSMVQFTPSKKMAMDNSGVIAAGFIFNAAAYAAYTALNKRHSVMIGVDAKFLAPIEIGHEIIFKGSTIQHDLKKCEVKVDGFLLDIKIFEAIFQIVVFHTPIFKLKFKDDK